MTTVGVERLLTAEEFYRRPEGSRRFELVKGVIIPMSPTNYDHGLIVLKLGRLIGNFVAEHDLGDTLGAETGFTLSHDPDTVHAPDVAFVSKIRRPAPRMGFVELAPDLVVEVVSPSDAPDEIQAKVEDYLDAGVKLVWLVYPRTQSVTVYRSLTDARILRAPAALTADEMLPAFSLPVAHIFAS